MPLPPAPPRPQPCHQHPQRNCLHTRPLRSAPSTREPNGRRPESVTEKKGNQHVVYARGISERRLKRGF
eukprot:405678-Rhodomonas_salina.1